jgi:hypothetical protein
MGTYERIPKIVHVKEITAEENIDQIAQEIDHTRRISRISENNSHPLLHQQ